ncbi:hypothetical protein HMI01_11230 [Halolactibacillus miurensis]|uniref:Uncharacterized protein n=1 Tax=Halolactibacillus miurensis TaxID=306541 RepID=A0A1I6SGC7_9BACI|nr:hypothetical protein [Halolactibacillus miurensis]GEM04135.1 hypothetical protein HMI01_11230 [Halolactibacillus miurensis]SFS75870.1 hypothetical protein SAMN05421668_10919 [Halolactibacillus miurensis]
MKKLKLSELDDDVEIGIDGAQSVQTVAELKQEINLYGAPIHDSDEWFVLIRRRWNPNAQTMLEYYIDNEEGDMYEDWYEQAWDCISDGVIEKIQTILDEAFSGDYATAYWTYENPVEIDVFPKSEEGER